MDGELWTKFLGINFDHSPLPTFILNKSMSESLDSSQMIQSVPGHTLFKDTQKRE